MSAFWAQVIAAIVGAVTTGAVRYLSSYLPRRTAQRNARSAPDALQQDADAE